MKASETRLYLTEAQWQSQIVDLAELHGWRTHHDRGDYRNCIAGDPGFPDLCMTRRGRVVFAEVKSTRGVATLAQALWLAAFTDTDWQGWLSGETSAVETGHVGVYIWRPSDLSKVQEVLA